MPKAARASGDAVRFGAIVRRLRTERGWTLVKLSRRCGMNPTYLGVLEKGGNVPSLATILELADVFSVEAAEIMRELEQGRKQARAQHPPASEHSE
jgi:transcriptional regulator with XRE-family HTH domain